MKSEHFWNKNRSWMIHHFIFIKWHAHIWSCCICKEFVLFLYDELFKIIRNYCYYSSKHPTASEIIALIKLLKCSAKQTNAVVSSATILTASEKCHASGEGPIQISCHLSTMLEPATLPFTQVFDYGYILAIVIKYHSIPSPCC